MSFLFKIFRKKEEDDESVLSALAQDIQKRQTKLDEIRQRERRTTFWASIYLLSLWAAYVAAWYFGYIQHNPRRKFERATRAFPVVAGPIVVLFIRRIVQAWFNRKGDAEERTLRELRKTQHIKIEEIKKKTNYYSTRDLIRKYDQSNSPMQTPRRPNAGIQLTPPKNNNPQKTLVSRPSPPQLSPPSLRLSSPIPVEPPRRRWYDKLVDTVLGDEEANATVPRYALICEKCFAHNGLVKESVWEETQYVCPKCNHLNPSMRSKRERQLGSPSRTPTSPGESPWTPQSVTSRIRSPTMNHVTQSGYVQDAAGSSADKAQQSNVNLNMMDVDA